MAQANPCYEFVERTGDVDALGNANAASTSVTMNGDHSITANFAPIPLSINWLLIGGITGQ